MNRGAIVAAAEDLIKREGQTTTVQSGVNATQDHIARRHDFRGMLYTPSEVSVEVEDLPLYSYGLLPDTFHHIIHATLWNGSTWGQLDVKTKRWFEETYPRGRWDHWFGYEGKKWDGEAYVNALFIVPKPNVDHCLHVVVSRIPSDLDEDDDESDIDGIDWALVYGSCEYTMIKLFGPLSDSAKGWMGKKEIEILKAIDNDKYDPALFIQAAIRGRLGADVGDINRPNPTFEGVSGGTWSGIA